MKSHLWKYFFSFTFFIGPIVSAQPTTCDLDKLDPAHIDEQDLPGTVLMTLDVSPAIKYSFELSDHKEITDYFMSTTNETTFTFSLNKTLDLEAIHDRHHIILSAVTVLISCTENGNPGGSNQLFVIVKAVNEFPPEFVNSPFEISVKENTDRLTSLFKLRDHATDQDVNPAQEEIHDFEIHPFYAAEAFKLSGKFLLNFDGRTYFMISNVQDGIISVSVPPDYEGIHREQKYFKLNLSVNDYGGKFDATTMTIHILDDDDLPPEFYEPGCSSDCYVLYETTIDVNFTGLLDNIDPYKIQARDRDTLNYTIAYTIKGTKPKGYDSYFQQENRTGEVTVIKPFSDTNDSLTLVTLFLEAHQTQGQPSLAQTSFKITIDRGLPPDKPIESVAAAGIDGTLMIILIVLAVVVFIMAGSFLVAVFCLKKKLKRPIYPDDSSSPSEKDTDIEELSADGQEQWPAPGVATLNGLPTGRGNTLPPLRDMATGTDDGKKTRRSRRRKKEKDTHEFDGTQEYESSAEPEFYEQKKSKIKRSSRSKQQTDPKYWITVDNDY